MTVRPLRRGLWVVAFAGSGVVAAAQAPDSLIVAAARWRSIGPALASGRLSDVVGIPGPSKTLFVAAAAGGVWKSGNNGVTWRPVFDDKRVASMGVLAIAATDTQVIWAGTGEANLRYPSEPGGGVFKSTDGGSSWQLMGLERTERIGRIVVHPKDPNIVYVAALGALYGRTTERGLYKTSDGGKSWVLSKFIDDRTGFVDIAMDPRNPDVLYATSWQVRRTAYSLESGGPGSALWKTENGGRTWTEIVGHGFPTGVKGRIGVAVAPSNPDIVYALTEAARPGTGTTYVPEYHAPFSGLYRSADAGRTWAKTSDYNDRPFYYSQVRVDPRDSERIYFSSSPLQFSVDGGKTSRLAAQGVHIDTHGIWIDPSDPERWAIADDGGFSITFDKGGTFLSPMNLPVAQFYHVGLDNAVPYRVCAGAQDNGVLCGPSRRKSGSTTNADWSLEQGGDMAYAIPDPSDPQVWYTESTSGMLTRLNLQTGEATTARKPHWEARYQWWEDSIATVRGNPLAPAPKAVIDAIKMLRVRQHQDSLDLDIRFGWDA
ncbi:MAG: glycosyl hydrolase, partial [Gemmatimonadetes bacterium]|nr:glycosyl hydrolase [Gemmatimonadota bacterium]